MKTTVAFNFDFTKLSNSINAHKHRNKEKMAASFFTCNLKRLLKIKNLNQKVVFIVMI